MNKSDFFIDKITSSIEDGLTGKRFETEIVPVVSGDFKLISKKKGWRFNWRIEFVQKDRQVYKLLVKNGDEIEGLISLQALENYIEMHLIETAPRIMVNQRNLLVCLATWPPLPVRKVTIWVLMDL